MAFCPHCGKEAGNQATTCIGCGKPLGAAQKQAAVRFKGTMMMQPAAVPAAAAAPAPTAPAPTAPVAAAHAAPAPTPAATTPAAGGAKRGFQGTMIGTGIPGVAGGATPAGPTPGDAASRAAASSLADTAPASDAAPAIAAAKAAAEAQAAAAKSVPPPASGHADDSQRFLVGDPMAPHEDAARHPPARHHAPHHEEAQKPSWMLVAVGFVGILVIAGIGVGVAVYLGLLEL